MTTPKKFAEFIEAHKSQLAAVSFEVGTPGFWDLVRLWNTLAMMFPEKCENVVQCLTPDLNTSLVTTQNPWREAHRGDVKITAPKVKVTKPTTDGRKPETAAQTTSA